MYIFSCTLNDLVFFVCLGLAPKQYITQIPLIRKMLIKGIKTVIYTSVS